MYHQDFLLRQIEQLAKAIRAILKDHQSGRAEEAYERLDGLYQTQGRFLSSHLSSWQPEAFLHHVEAEGFEPGELEALSRLIETEGQMLEADDAREQATHRYQIALLFLEQAAYKDTDNFSLSRQQRIKTLRERFNQSIK